MVPPQKRKNKNSSKCCYSDFISTIKEYLLPKSPLVNNKSKIPKWRDVTPIQKLAYYSVYINIPNRIALTLNFSNKFIHKFSHLPNKKLKDVIRRRLNQNFKNNLGIVPNYAFIIERKESNFHIHGIIELDSNQIELAKRTMKVTAFGVGFNKSPMKNNILDLQYIYNKNKWLCYMIKNHKNVINSLYISNGLLTSIRNDYNAL